MKLRFHRGGLAESLETTVEIPNTKEAVVVEINKHFNMQLNPRDVRSELYGFDSRIPSKVYIIRIIGQAGVYAMTDEAIKR